MATAAAKARYKNRQAYLDAATEFAEFLQTSPVETSMPPPIEALRQRLEKSGSSTV